MYEYDVCICLPLTLIGYTCAINTILFCKTWTEIFGTLANNADPAQAPRNAASDQTLHWLLKLEELKG